MSTLYPPRKVVKTVTVSAVRWSLAIVFTICMAATLAVAIQGQVRDENLRKITATQQAAIARIDENTRRLDAAIGQQCLDRRKAYSAINTTLSTLMENVRITKSLPESEKKQRYAAYERAKVKLVQCPK